MSDLERRVAAIELKVGIVERYRRVIDWGKVAINTPVRVWDFSEKPRLLLFERYDKDCTERPFLAHHKWRHASLETGVWVFNDKGVNPWPEGVRVECKFRDGESDTSWATSFNWSDSSWRRDVITSRVVGLDDGWVYE